jgi:hypothetical protein
VGAEAEVRSFRSLLVLAALFAGVVAYLYFVDSKKPLEQAAEEKPKVFAGVEADKIDQLKISTIAGGVAELQKTADGWKLTSPLPARGDDSEVTSVTTNLASVTMDRIVDEAPSNVADFGLKEPVAEVSFKQKGDKDFRTLEIGSKTATGNDLYARVAGDKKVFLIAGYLESTFNRKPFDLRDKKVMNFDREKVDRMEILQGNANVTVAKSGGEWRVVAPVEARGDFGTIEGIVSKLQTTQMKSVVDDNATDLKKYGLDKPSALVTISLGSARAGFALGSKDPSGDYFARDVSKNQVVTVGADTFTELQKTASDLRRKDVFEFRTFNLAKIELTRGADTIVFERLKGKGKDGADAWQNATTKKTLDATKAEAFLTRLSGLRAQSFADAKDKTGLDHPILVVKASFDDGKKTETASLGREGANTFASRPDEPGAAKLDTAEVDGILKDLDALK